MKYLRIFCVFLFVCLILIFTFRYGNINGKKVINKAENNINNSNNNVISNENDEKNEVKRANIVANGDLLYHDLLYMSALQEDGTYNFENNYKYVKEFISSADLAIADYEGTIDERMPLSGYPLFNAPSSVVKYIKDAGYDVFTLAQNHILDSGLEGLKSTAKIFKDGGMDIFGVYTDIPREKSEILVKNVNGIRIALLAYCYGFNGLESNLTEEEYNNHMSDLNEVKIKEEIEKAEKIADITIVFPHMGIEYQLEPTEEQIRLFDKMIDWGADVVLGGHPHVLEPTKTIQKDGKNKFIIYSMGNFISNQRIETLDNKWTERGVLVDLDIEKDKTGTYIKGVKLHPTWVIRSPQDRSSSEGYQLYNYSTVICEDVIKNRGKYSEINDDDFKRIENAYNETIELLNLDKLW